MAEGVETVEQSEEEELLQLDRNAQELVHLAPLLRVPVVLILERVASEKMELGISGWLTLKVKSW